MELHPPVYINLKGRLDDIIVNQLQQLVNGGQFVADLSNLQPEDGDYTVTKQDEATVKLYSQLRQFYNEGNFNEIMFLLPQISRLNIIPQFSIWLLVVLWFISEGYRVLLEIGVAICLAPNEVGRKEFIKVLAFTYADLNDKDSAMGCLGEILDISRGSLLGTKQFDQMKFDICQLEKDILIKLEQAKTNK